MELKVPPAWACSATTAIEGVDDPETSNAETTCKIA